MMADLSDNIDNLKVYYKKISQNEHDAIFSSHFMHSSKVKDYPFKIISRGINTR